VLLITSRASRRWVIPKGWPMRKRTDAEAAEREAYEEAGVKGEIAKDSFGLFTYSKQLAPGKSIPCVVRVFALEVHSLLRKYPENGQRKSKWLSRKNAASKVREPELKLLIRNFDPGKV
jgi:8-oxo-dGTP pyrophosphatase MutT (NUDIX family)